MSLLVIPLINDRCYSDVEGDYLLSDMMDLLMSQGVFEGQVTARW